MKGQVQLAPEGREGGHGLKSADLVDLFGEPRGQLAQQGQNALGVDANEGLGFGGRQ